jgi:hypothetical protein
LPPLLKNSSKRWLESMLRWSRKSSPFFASTL